MSGFNFKLFPASIKKIDKSAKLAVEATGEKMLSEKIQSQEIPLLEGQLQNVQTRIDKSQINQGKLAIMHDTPYAKRLYYHPEYNFTKDFNTNAGGEWWEDYLTGDKRDRPKEIFKFYMKRYGGKTIQ